MADSANSKVEAIKKWLITNIPCICHEGYYERDLIDPACHSFAHKSGDSDELREAAEEILAIFVPKEEPNLAWHTNMTGNWSDDPKRYQ